MQNVDIKILDPRLGKDFPLPDYATEQAAGMDLRAMVENNFVLNPGEVVMVPAGFAMHINNAELCAVIVPRSGLGYKHGIVLSNLTGIIDSDYQGPLKMPLWNHSKNPFTVHVGDRIAQMLFMPIVRAKFNIVTEFPPSKRGDGGFGSTGL